MPARGGDSGPRVADSRVSPVAMDYPSNTGNVDGTATAQRSLRERAARAFEAAKSWITGRGIPSDPDARVAHRDIMRSAEAAMANVSKTFGIKLGFVEKGVRGYYDRIRDIARIASVGDIPAAVHEIGHGISHEKVVEKLIENANETVLGQLEVLGQAIYETEPHNGWISEGFAELVRSWLTAQRADWQRLVGDGGQNAGIAPDAVTWFENEVLPQLGDNRGQDFIDLRAMMHKYDNQGAVNRGMANLIDMGKRNVPFDFKARIRDARIAHVDANAILMQISDYVREDTGKELLPHQDPAKLSAMGKLGYYAQAFNAVMDEGIFIFQRGHYDKETGEWVRNKDPNDKRGAFRKIGPALNEVQPLLEGANKGEFGVYLVAKRSLALKDNKKAQAKWLSRALQAPVEWDADNGEFHVMTETGVVPFTDGKLIARAKKATAKNTPMSEKDAVAAIARLESPAFANAADIVYQFSDAMLTYMASKSPAFVPIVNRMRANDAGFYAPLSRYFYELGSWQADARKGGGSDAQRGAIGHGQKGSTRPEVKDPIPQLISNAQQMFRAANDRAVIDALVALTRPRPPETGEKVTWVTAKAGKTKTATYVKRVNNRFSQVKLENGQLQTIKTDRLTGEHDWRGVSKLITPVDPSREMVASETVTDVIKQLRAKLAEQDATLEITDDAGRELSDEELIGFVEMFRLKTKYEGNQPVVPILTDGKVTWLQVDPQLYDALQTNEIYNPGGGVLNLLVGAPNRTFRAMTTTFNTAFGLLKNPLRDVQTAAINTRAATDPWNNVKGYFGEVLGSAKELLAHAGTGVRATAGAADKYVLDRMSGKAGMLSGVVAKAPDVVEKVRGKEVKWEGTQVNRWAKLMGLHMSQPMGQDTAITRDLGSIVTGNRTLRQRLITAPANWIRDGINIFEATARNSEVANLARQRGIDLNRMTWDQMIEMSIAWKEVPADFSAAGTFTRRANYYLPFYAAQIAGLRSYSRAAVRNPKDFAIRQSSMAFAGLLA